MASKVGISQQAYQKIESGNTKLDIDRAKKIAQELDLDLQTLMNSSPSNYWYNCTLSGSGAFHQHLESKAHIETLKEMITMLKEENYDLKPRLGLSTN